MEHGVPLVSIPFKLFLYDICAYLGLGAPVFHPSLYGIHNCFVVVDGPNTLRSLLAYGGEKSSFDESAENAAREMVVYLVKKHKIRVDDVNLSTLDGLNEKLAPIKQKDMLIHISPTYDLSLSNTLKWVVRAVEHVQAKSSGKAIEAGFGTSYELKDETQASDLTKRTANRRRGKSHVSSPIACVDHHPDEDYDSPPVSAKLPIHAAADNEFVQAHIEAHSNRPFGKSPANMPPTSAIHLSADLDEDSFSATIRRKQGHGKSPEETPATPTKCAGQRPYEHASDEETAALGSD